MDEARRKFREPRSLITKNHLFSCLHNNAFMVPYSHFNNLLSILAYLLIANESSIFILWKKKISNPFVLVYLTHSFIEYSIIMVSSLTIPWITISLLSLFSKILIYLSKLFRFKLLFSFFFYLDYPPLFIKYYSYLYYSQLYMKFDFSFIFMFL